MENKEWKEVRSLVSPSFSTGKIKQVSIYRIWYTNLHLNMLGVLKYLENNCFSLQYSLQMKECADKLCTNLQSIASDGGKIQLKE